VWEPNTGDYAGFDPGGAPLTKAKILSAFSGPFSLEELTVFDRSARVLGEVGLVSGCSQMRGRGQGTPFALMLRFTDVYALRDDAWTLVASQVTALAPPESQ
jgi:uncharacterized protein DUF4440